MAVDAVDAALRIDQGEAFDVVDKRRAVEAAPVDVLVQRTTETEIVRAGLFLPNRPAAARRIGRLLVEKLLEVRPACTGGDADQAASGIEIQYAGHPACIEQPFALRELLAAHGVLRTGNGDVAALALRSIEAGDHAAGIGRLQHAGVAGGIEAAMHVVALAGVRNGQEGRQVHGRSIGGVRRENRYWWLDAMPWKKVAYGNTSGNAESDWMDDSTLGGNPWPLIDAMKRGLRREGITYAQLAQRLQLSEASIKRLFSRGRFTLQQVLAVCEAIGTDLAELGRSAQNRAEAIRQLSVAQERALAGDPRLLLLFHLLMAGWSLADIGREYALQGTERTLLLARLERLGQIELLPRDRVRLRIARDFFWRSNGPVRRRYGAQALREF